MSFFLNDPTFNILSNFLSANGSGYPPYNVWIEGIDQKEYVIEVAVAGFSDKELDVEFNKRTLTITGKKKDEGDPTATERRYIHQGLAKRSFTRKFEIQGNLELGSVILDNGILTLRLKDKTETLKIPIMVVGQNRT